MLRFWEQVPTDQKAINAALLLENDGLVGQWGASLSDQPFIDGVNLNFKPTPDFEFGVGLTTMIGGPGVPRIPQIHSKPHRPQDLPSG